MHLPPYSSSRTRPRAPLVVAVPLLAPLLVSCASPGPPRPPSLHLPDVVTDLTAQRVGDRVLLHWTSPMRTTDGLTAPAPLSAEICRETNPATQLATKKSSSAPGCVTVLHIPVVPGPSEAADKLPEQLTADPVLPLAYRIRILNPDGHSAGLSHPAIAVAGAAPPPVAGLRATASREGATLQWRAIPSSSLVELDRTLVSPGPATTQPKRSASPQLTSPSQPTNVRLRTGEEPHTADPGGTLDRTALRGQTYTYRAQRIRIVSADGHALELRSEPSDPVTVNLADIFPPAVPTGLAAVPGGTATRAAIDLSWQPNGEPDLAGYHVYRSTASGSFQRLTSAPVLGPAFSDTTVTPGTAYTYRVTAIDNSGNESPPSAEVTEIARPPQHP